LRVLPEARVAVAGTSGSILKAEEARAKAIHIQASSCPVGSPAPGAPSVTADLEVLAGSDGPEVRVVLQVACTGLGLGNEPGVEEGAWLAYLAAKKADLGERHFTHLLRFIEVHPPPRYPPPPWPPWPLPWQD